MDDLGAALDVLADETSFSGVVRVDRGPDTVFARAYGMARRDVGVANRLDTQFALASGSKGATALAVARLAEDGALRFDDPVRPVLGDDLPLIADDVTVEHLLAHRSGIGDYLDEAELEGVDDYVLAVPVHQLATTEQYLAVLDGHTTKFRAGTRFSYCNGGYVVLALVAERVSGVPFHDLVASAVCEPAGMIDAAYLRSDELPGRAAAGYLAASGLHTNVLHLPVRGSGDGGMYATVADVHALWRALFAGRIVTGPMLAMLLEPRSTDPESGRRYGLGFWRAETGPAVALEGCDAGVSFRSVHDPGTGVTRTVVSNTTDGAWPVSRLLEARSWAA